MSEDRKGSRLPLWLKLAYTAFMAVWVPVYWIENGPGNFLWLCDVANFVILVALWLESALLLSSQATAVLLVQLLWMLDLGVALLTGVHPLGGTEYMLSAETATSVRLLSLFHVWIPLLLLWSLRQSGYDPRGWKLQTVIGTLMLMASYLWTAPEKNVNWLHRPFGLELPWLSPEMALVAAFVAYPLLIYLPTHLALKRNFRRTAP